MKSITAVSPQPSFLATMASLCETAWEDELFTFPNRDGDGSAKNVTGRQLYSYLIAVHGSAEERVRFMRQQERALEDAAYLVAALKDPKHGAGKAGLADREVQDTLPDLIKHLSDLRMLEPYEREDGSLGLAI